MEAAERVVGELLPLVRRFCVGPCGVALGGSHAKGRGDALSDVDVYLFAAAVLPGAARGALVREALGAESEPVSWGSDDPPFREGGTDFRYGRVRVECWLRSSREMESTLAACARGEIRREHSLWAVMGFFNYAALADVHAMRVVEDPEGVLARWKREVAAYPEALRRAVLRRFTREAAFWPENPHYRSAVERGDVIYTSAIVQQVLHATLQVAFALNREYFPGEKKLAPALEGLPMAPPGLAGRVQALLCPGKAPGVEELREQRRELGALVDEVQRLVATHGGTAPGSA